MDSWKTVSYVQKGVIHQNDLTDCQDNVCLYENDKIIIAALSDGLGSLKYSSIASKAAVKTVCNLFQNEYAQIKAMSNKEGKQYILKTIQDTVQQKANENGFSTSKMDCTLVFVFIDKQEQQAIVGQLGDSVVCLIGEEKSIALSEAGSLANATSTVMDQKALEYFSLSFCQLSELKALGFILSSDGLENEIYTKGSRHVLKSAELYFNSLFSSEPQAAIEELVRRLTDIPDTPFDDDISLLVLNRANKPIVFPKDPTWLCSCGHRNPLQATYCLKCEMDFSILYQDIKFREHGGKSAFFSKINQNPAKEHEIVEKAKDQRTSSKKQTQPIFEFGEKKQEPVNSMKSMATQIAISEGSSPNPIGRNIVQKVEKQTSGSRKAEQTETKPSLTPEEVEQSLNHSYAGVTQEQSFSENNVPEMHQSHISTLEKDTEFKREQGNSALVQSNFEKCENNERNTVKRRSGRAYNSYNKRRLKQENLVHEQNNREMHENDQDSFIKPRCVNDKSGHKNNLFLPLENPVFRIVALVALIAFILGFVFGCVTTKSIISKKYYASEFQPENPTESLPNSSYSSDDVTEDSQPYIWNID